MVRVLVAAVLAGATVMAQNGTITLRPLPGRPGIDGRAWMLVEPYTGATPQVRPAGADYELRFSGRTEDRGVARWTVTLDRAGHVVDLTGSGKTAFVYVTPDARYVVLEPLIVVNTATGERLAFDAGPGMKIIAIAQDGRRLFLERADGEPFELTVPE